LVFLIAAAAPSNMPAIIAFLVGKGPGNSGEVRSLALLRKKCTKGRQAVSILMKWKQGVVVCSLLIVLHGMSSIIRIKTTDHRAIVRTNDVVVSPDGKVLIDGRSGNELEGDF